jgi:DNA invertase Pin-like site-specific DNA recombinase
VGFGMVDFNSTSGEFIEDVLDAAGAHELRTIVERSIRGRRAKAAARK